MAALPGGGAPAPLFVYITNNMQALYARRGMWAGGAPQGALAGMLGPIAPAWCNEHRQAFFVSPAQLADLWRDLTAPRAITEGGRHQSAQFQRRLRESALRAGLNLPDILKAFPGTWSQGSAAAAAPPPLVPLQGPAAGQARDAFERHVMRTTREFVVFTQGSQYLKGANHA